MFSLCLHFALETLESIYARVFPLTLYLYLDVDRHLPGKSRYVLAHNMEKLSTSELIFNQYRLAPLLGLRIIEPTIGQ
ncbi:hypothetical protein DFH07DRAFT_819756 [Mycena maculata]|uniref:Uncharacterized protein n=1 Tax=Mycena maculata TaxID=230809 RepID=A0AAD7J538_9AGAR|nr:hypothetical protein DFH07DRAFT_819756 [Mycena maculata]